MLISWPGENNALSVVPSRRINEPLDIGCLCEVADGRKKHTARILATGTHNSVHVMFLHMSICNAKCNAPTIECCGHSEYR